MATSDPFTAVNLCEDDVPGAKINVDNVSAYSNYQLKRWLECRGLTTGGNKAKLVKRVNDCVESGGHDSLDITVDKDEDESSINRNVTHISLVFGGTCSACYEKDILDNHICSVEDFPVFKVWAINGGSLCTVPINHIQHC
ncbi:uncharacterized protein LOC144361240 [Saccoglossus kowalevskii]